MNRLRRLAAILDTRGWIFPSLFFLVLAALAYAPLIASLGFYWDDWPVIYQIDNGSDFWSFYAYDRPFSAWTYLVTAPLFGIRPLGWHVFSFVLRWLTVVGVWWNLKLLWPERGREVLWIGLIFALHPAFSLQPIAVAFSQHLLTYVLFLLSTGAMLLAQRQPARFRLYTALALAGQFLHMLTMEYFWGLELLRPVLLWSILSYQKNARLRSVLRSWSPYLLVSLLLVLWRLFVLELPGGDPNSLALLDLIRQSPLEGLQAGLRAAVQDSLYLMLQAWTGGLAIEGGGTSDRFRFISWVWAALATSFTFFALRWKAKDRSGPPAGDFHRAALWLGGAALLLAMAPVWITGNQITRGLYGTRFSLGAILGGSILLVGLASYFLRPEMPKWILFSVLAGLAVGAHLRHTNGFRWDWHDQANFYWQLVWRAPGLEPGTALVSDGAVFRYEGGYPTSAAINTIYTQARAYPEQSYWFFELDNTYWRDMETFVSGVNLQGSLRNLEFSGRSRDSLIIFFQPETGSCLRVLSPEDGINPVLPELTAEAAVVSDLSRIHLEPNADLAALRAMFGPEPEPSWCQYFQKASLALQMREYSTVVELERTARAARLSPNNTLEWSPFIEAHARLGDWSGAAERAIEAFEGSKKTRARPSFCALWERIAGDAGPEAPEPLGCE